MTSSLKAPSTLISEKVTSMFYAKLHLIPVRMSAVVGYTPQGLSMCTEHSTGA